MNPTTLRFLVSTAFTTIICDMELIVEQIILFVALGSLTYGYASSIIATTLAQPSFIAYFNLNPKTRVSL